MNGVKARMSTNVFVYQKAVGLVEQKDLSHKLTNTNTQSKDFNFIGYTKREKRPKK